MFDIEKAIVEWRRTLSQKGLVDAPTLNELESHLRDEIDQQLIRGLNLERSFQLAIGQIGSATSLNTEFKKVTTMKTQKAEKILGAVGFGAFASISVYGLFF